MKADFTALTMVSAARRVFIPVAHPKSAIRNTPSTAPMEDLTFWEIPCSRRGLRARTIFNCTSIDVALKWVGLLTIKIREVRFKHGIVGFNRITCTDGEWCFLPSCSAHSPGRLPSPFVTRLNSPNSIYQLFCNTTKSPS